MKLREKILSRINYKNVIKHLKTRHDEGYGVSVKSLSYYFYKDFNDFYTELYRDQQKKLEQQIGYRVRKFLREGVDKGEVDEGRQTSRGRMYTYVTPQERRRRKERRLKFEKTQMKIINILRFCGFSANKIEDMLCGTSVDMSAKDFFKLVNAASKKKVQA
jgi:hypothetical protein